MPIFSGKQQLKDFNNTNLNMQFYFIFGKLVKQYINPVFISNPLRIIMLNPFYLSDYFLPLLNKVKFAITVIVKFFKILFRRQKNIQLLKLEYSQRYLFNESYLIVSYRFKNVLWYNFKNLKKTTKSNPIVFNIKNIGSSNITLIAHGFFRRKKYRIDFNPAHILERKTFKTAISNINNNYSFIAPISHVPKVPILYIPTIEVNKKEIKTSHSPYNQISYL